MIQWHYKYNEEELYMNFRMNTEVLFHKYKVLRVLLLLPAIFALLNSMFLLMGWDAYMSIGPAVPFYVTLFGMLYTNRLPSQWYLDENGKQFSYDLQSMEYGEYLELLFWGGIALAALYFIGYVLLFCFSGKRPSLCLTGCVIYCLDLVALCVFGIMFPVMTPSALEIVLRSLFALLLMAITVLGFVAKARRKNEERKADQIEPERLLEELAHEIEMEKEEQ